jgi:hypothetical protein
VPDDKSRGRGRPPRAEAAEPTGYRVTAAVRRQLTLAMGFTNERGLQAIVDRAVHEYLAHLRETIPGFADAVDAAEAHVTGRPQNVTPFRRER